MHATFRIGGTKLMASDGCEESPRFAGFSLSLAVPTEAEAKRAFAALAASGQVKMPLTKTFWRRASACSPTASASAGWSVSRLNRFLTLPGLSRFDSPKPRISNPERITSCKRQD